MRRRSSMLALSALALFTAAPLALAQPSSSAMPPVITTPAPQPGLITTSATGRVSRTPDYVELNVGVTRQAASADEAQTMAAGDMEKVVSAIEALKIANLETRTSSVDLQPRYGPYRDDRAQEVVGYTATMTLYVKSKDIKAGPRLLTSSINAGANVVNRFEFGISEALEAREEALRLAVAAARRKAETIAGALNVRLGKLHSASESSSSGGGWPQMRMANVAVGGGMGGTPEGSVVPGTIDVSVDATLTFNVVE